MKKIFAVTGIILFIAAINACKKNSADTTVTPPTDVYNPTPLTLQIPAYVTTFNGAILNPADNALTVEGVALGRRLFYDNKLSNDLTMHCGSCHKQENAFDDPRQFSQGTNGMFGSRNAMSIMNMGWNTSFFWDGRRSSLEGQAHDPVTNPIEMANTWPTVVQRLQADTMYTRLFFKAFGTQTIDSDLVVKAIAQFERTLVSYSSLYDKYAYLHTANYTGSQSNGYELFQLKHCTSCHNYGAFTDYTFRNNGLDITPPDSGRSKFTHDPADYGKFKVPSLRNIALTGPYMHDGRFTTLEDVVGFYSRGVHQNSPNLDTNMQFFTAANSMTQQEQADIVAYLKTLTDSTIATNPDFSAP